MNRPNNPPNSVFFDDFGGLSDENNPPNSVFFIDFGGLSDENNPPNSVFFDDFGGLSHTITTGMAIGKRLRAVYRPKHYNWQ